MSHRKTVVLGVCLWATLAASSRADSVVSTSGWSIKTYGSRLFTTEDSDLGSALVSLSNAGIDTNPAAPFYPASLSPAAGGSTTITSLPVSSALTTLSPTPASASYASGSGSGSVPDAFLNFGKGTYAEAGSLTTGTIQSWADSASVAHAFGGAPNAQQQADFVKAVFQDVEQTYQMSGISIHLTLDPNAHAAHTLSVVSGASYTANPGAIGITDVGGNGFGFIDKLSYASSVTDLEWAVAHNIAHELMHAFGVATHHDTTGAYLDAATAQWSLLTNPNTVFSPEAAQDIQAHLAAVNSATAAGVSVGAELLKLYGPLPHKPGCQCSLCLHGYELLVPQAVPEPATVALWGACACALLACRRRRDR